VAVSVELASGGSCDRAGVGVTGVASKPYRATATEALLVGNPLNDAAIESAANLVCENVDANADLYASEDYRKHLAKVYTKRALLEAVS
jgi:carbon-monoxide dehydrogenase medium subunit